MHGTPKESEGLLVVPFGEGQNSEIFIVVGSCRAVNDNRTYNTLSILSSVMTVVPAGPVLSGNEFVSFSHAGRNWTLGEAVSPIVLIGIELTEPVPMNTCAVMRHVVVHDDPYPVTPVRSDGRARVLAVDELAELLRTTVRGTGGIGDSQVKGMALTGLWPALVDISIDVKSV